LRTPEAKNQRPHATRSTTIQASGSERMRRWLLVGQAMLGSSHPGSYCHQPLRRSLVQSDREEREQEGRAEPPRRGLRDRVGRSRLRCERRQFVSPRRKDDPVPSSPASWSIILWAMPGPPTIGMSTSSKIASGSEVDRSTSRPSSPVHAVCGRMPAASRRDISRCQSHRRRSVRWPLCRPLLHSAFAAPEPDATKQRVRRVVGIYRPLRLQ
jgi:hypothetical protein